MKTSTIIFLLFWVTCIPVLAQPQTTLTLDDRYASRKLEETIITNANDILRAINTAYDAQKELDLRDLQVTEQGKEFIELLWAGAPFFCPEPVLSRHLIAKGDPIKAYEIRNVPFSIRARTPSGEFHQEQGVLLFTAQGLISGLYFGIEDSAYKALTRSSSDEDEYWDKQEILDFLDNFRTAYNQKNLDFIDRVFSEDALIIVGRVVQEEATLTGRIKYADPKHVELIPLNKQEYLSRLDSAFSKNEYINVSFEKITIEQDDYYHQLYIVKLQQHWASTTYSDSGYLFLLIDMQNRDMPIIHVRTWQPKKGTPPSEVFDIENLRLPTPSN